MTVTGTGSPPAGAATHWWHVLPRVVVAVVGGYAVSASVVTLLAVLLPRALGMARSEAVFLSAMLGFVVYLIALLWAFVERQMWRLWTVLLGGAVLGYGLVHGLTAAVGARA